MSMFREQFLTAITGIDHGFPDPLVRTPTKFAVSHREDIIRACDNLCGM